MTIAVDRQEQSLSLEPGAREPPEGLPDSGALPGIGLLQRDFDALGEDLDFESSEYAVSGRYVWADSGWYVGGRLDRGTIDRPTDGSALAVGADTEGYGVWAGRYFGEVTAVEVRINSSERTSVQEISFPRLNLAFDIGARTSTDNLGVSVRRAGLLAGRLYWLSANLGRDRSDTRLIIPSILDFAQSPDIVPSRDIDRSTSGYQYGLTAGLYPNRAIGVRLNYTRGDDGGSLAGVSASWFFTPNAAVDVALARVELESRAYAVDVDVVMLRLLGRF